MEPVVTPLFIGHTGILCYINSPKCWTMKPKERLFTFEYFENNYKLAENCWQESDSYDDPR